MVAFGICPVCHNAHWPHCISAEYNCNDVGINTSFVSCSSPPPPNLPVKFKISPFGKSYLSCHIWDTRENMRAATNGKVGGGHSACFIGRRWKIIDDGIKTKHLGELHFSLEDMGAGIVAHELQHFITNLIATYQEFRDEFSLDNIADIEEICLIAGDLTREFWIEYYEVFEEATE